MAERFVPAPASANAVRVRMEQPGRLYFATALGIEAPVLAASAVAAIEPRAAFSIGSRLASLDDGLANAVLGQLLGTELSLSLLDYRAMAALDVSMLGFLDALAGQIGVSAGSYDQVLDATVALGDLVAALAVASAGSDPALAALFGTLAGAIDDAIVVEMVDLIAADGLASLGVGQAHAGIDAMVNAFSLLSAAALVADGQQQAGVTLGLDVPGIAGAQVRIAIGQQAQTSWFTLGPSGSFVRTAQVRVKLDLSVAGNGGLGIGLVSLVLPLYLDLASAQAQLTSLHCPHGDKGPWRAHVAVQPAIARLAVGQPISGSFEDMTRPLVFGSTPILSVAGLARIKAGADVAMSQTQPVAVSFSHADIAARTVRTVSTTTPLSGLSASLVSSLDLELEVLGLNLLGGLLSRLLSTTNALVAPLAPVIDTVLIGVLETLGIGLGEADIRLHAFDCRAPVLVQ